MTELLVVMLWQVVLIGGWAVSRRLRQLERSFNSTPSSSAQLGALREELLEFRTDHAFDDDEQARRIRDLETATSSVGNDMRRLVNQNETLHRSLVERIGRLERSLHIEPMVDRDLPGEPVGGWG